MEGSGDAELVEKVRAGDTNAYGVLVRRYQDTYMRFAVRMLGSGDDADDALQSAFLRAYRKIAECRDPERFGAWLYQIVVNECRTLAFRRDRRERRLVRDESGLEQHAVVSTEGAQFELEEVQRALVDLPLEQREAFVLKYVEELSYEEMSELTGAGVSALKMRVNRASQRLRQLLDPTRSVS